MGRLDLFRLHVVETEASNIPLETRNLIDHIILQFNTFATHYVWLRAILRTFLFFPCTQADLRHIERDKAQF